MTTRSRREFETTPAPCRGVPFTMLYTAVIAALLLSTAQAFTVPVFQEAPAKQHTVPSKNNANIDIELPDFDELFSRIQQISPLAKLVIDEHVGRKSKVAGKSGFDAMAPDVLQWKSLEHNPHKTVHSIDKIDSFNGEQAPLLRFRSTFNGPCVGEYFANFIMHLDQRKIWDAQIEQVYELFSADLDACNIAQGFGKKYGDCSRCGVGYCQTKPAGFGITSREQLTLCGIQEFQDQSCIIWGVEMEEWHNHLLPPGPRHTRAKSHIFSTTLTPGSKPNTVDIEYCLQLDIGGKIPVWLLTPIMVDTISKLFKCAEKYFANDKDGSPLDLFLKKRAAQDEFADRYALLMTP